ncbi:hypothetical protein Q9189_005971 [Teloschistes chrysophthalmus]
MATVPTSLHSHIPVYGGPYGGGRGPVIYPGEPIVDWNPPTPSPFSIGPGLLPPLPPHLRDTPIFHLYPSPSPTPSPSSSMDPVFADPPTPYFSPVNEPEPSPSPPVASPSPIVGPLPVIAHLAYRISVHRPGEQHHYSNGTSTSTTNGTTAGNQTKSSAFASASASATATRSIAYVSTTYAHDDVRSEATTGSKLGKGLVFFAVIGSLVLGMMGL